MCKIERQRNIQKRAQQYVSAGAICYVFTYTQLMLRIHCTYRLHSTSVRLQLKKSNVATEHLL
ncbi:hypothetical protein TERTU_4468 [Teredinibacter turnerae T7901]|uniref:Uncharacterized protein n=1 Tax=Teredinibacter turnerae (strain ATCC 39867 / T7901) TaxID=377629 RepID=C5BJ60_TERTT|nr:hypothetical protein TERTU_4468 [Teredinibacter turnerae T7901]